MLTDLQAAAMTLSGTIPVGSSIGEPRVAPSSFSRPAALKTPSSQLRARDVERRQVTVLVCGSDLFDSESYLELDAEDQAKMLPAFRETCEEAVRRFDGTIVQCNEHGLLACFGYPAAYEDAAPRAAPERPRHSGGHEGLGAPAPPRPQARAESLGRHPHGVGRRRGKGGRDFASGRSTERGNPAGGRRRGRPGHLHRGDPAA